MMWPTVSARAESGSKTVQHKRTGHFPDDAHGGRSEARRSPSCTEDPAFSVRLFSARTFTLFLAAFASVSLLSSCRAVQSVFHPDHGMRRIAFPAAASLTAPHVSGSCAVAGTTGGYGVFRFDLQDPGDPKFMRGIPCFGEITGSPAFLAYYGYFPVKEGLLVVGALTDSLEFFEFIPFPGVPRLVRVSESRRELFVLADDGLRTFDISLPSRPVLSGFDPAVKSGPPETQEATAAFCVLPDGGIVRLDSSNLNLVHLPDGGTRTYQEKVKDLFEKEGKFLVLTESDRLLDENGNEILPQAGQFALENNVSSWVAGDHENEFFHRENAGSKSVWRLPAVLKGCRAFHTDGDLFAALHDHTLHFGVLNSRNQIAEIKSSVPVIDLEGPVCSRGSMTYGVSGHDGRHFLLYGMDHRLPPRDGTPYDFLFSYELPPESVDEKYVPSANSALAVGDFLFVPGALIRLSWTGPELVCPLGAPAGSVHPDESGRRVIMTYAKREKGNGPGAVVYDISELPVIRKVSEIEDPSGFVDSAAAGEDLWLLSPDGRIVCCDMSTGKKISEIPAPANARASRLIRNGSFLHILPSPEDPENIWRVADIRDPEKPFIRNEIGGLLPYGVTDAALSGNSLFVAGGYRIGRFDISNPEKPVWRENFRGKDVSRTNYTDLEVCGTLLIGRKQGFLDVWDDWEEGDNHDDDGR
ncbi:MAG: hypothetical protein J5944_06055 [Lentisphaeria bacterium]|nr:hypothetical protein [Lentisphaeria bacterium]